DGLRRLGAYRLLRRAPIRRLRHSPPRGQRSDRYELRRRGPRPLSTGLREYLLDMRLDPRNDAVVALAVREGPVGTLYRLKPSLQRSLACRSCVCSFSMWSRASSSRGAAQFAAVM